MKFAVELNCWIVAKDKKDLVPVNQEVFGAHNTSSYAVTKSGQRVYPIGDEFTLPIIVDGKCCGVGYITNVSISETNTTITYVLVQEFMEDDPMAYHYEAEFDRYKSNQEAINNGGRMDLTPEFMKRRHAQ